MTATTNPIATRLERMLKVAGTQAELARMGQVSPGTLINWLRGLGFHDSTMTEFANACGVDFAWLRDGAGNDLEQIRKFKDRLEVEERSRVAEEPPEMQINTPSHGPYAVLEKTAGRMTPDGVAETIADILRDDTVPLLERYASSERLAIVLARRLGVELKRHRT